MFTNFDITPCFLFTVLLASNMVQPSKTQVNCDLDRPCFNGGTCRPSALQNPCTCPAGFVEPFCTTSCLTVPCQNGGTCSDDVCSCSQGYAGPTCQSAIAVYLSPLEVSVTEGDTGNSNARIHLCRQQSDQAATVTVFTSPDSAAAALDFVNINTRVTIPFGQVCAPVDVLIVSDMTIEPTEVFHVVISPTQLTSSVHIVPGQQTATVTIIDNDDTQPPVITNCPGDRSISIAPGTSSASVFWQQPTASDNSGDVTLTSSHQPGDTFPLGQTTVTITATDGAGNTQQCQFVITVMIDVDECTTTTLCDSRSSTCMNIVGSYSCMCRSGYTGSPFIPGQQFTCSDNTPPIISDCPSNTVLGAVSQDDDSVAISWTEPTATDDISEPVTVVSSHRSGDHFSIGSTTVTYTFTDAAGNSEMCSFVVFVFKIMLQCPGTVTVMAGSQVSFNNPTCLRTTSGTQVSSSSCEPAVGSTISSDTQVSCSCNNFPNVQCSFEVFVTGLPITIQCPNPITVMFGSPLQYTTPSCNRNGNLGSSVTCSPSSVLTLTDDIDVTCTCNSYQAYSCSFHVTVTGAPATIQCPDDLTVQVNSLLIYPNPTCISKVGSSTSQSSCSPVVGSRIMSDVEVTCTCFFYQTVQCSFMVTVEAYVDCPETQLLYAGDRLSFTNPSCMFMGISSTSTCDPQSGFRVLSQSQQVTCTCDNYPDTQCTFPIITQMDCLKTPCNENCYCEEATSCTNLPSVCSSECRIFGCSANITSESLSQVNPQSSVEIKCILEGSTAVVNILEIRLSRSEEGLDDVGINQVNAPELPSNRRVSTYRVMNVSQDDQFFCILLRTVDAIGAVSVTEFVYDLPSISDPPTEVTRTTTSVTITWRPWNEETDVGDPPVVAYIPYYKMDPTQDWMSGSRIQADQTLEYTASSLESDRNYTFSVAAVRGGEGGEGPRGPPVTIKTLCIKVVPQMVTTTLTATNDVTVTWQQPTVQCSTGITQFTIYYEIEGDVSSRKEAGRANPNAETFTVDGSLLEPGTTYNIAVTVTADQESALSEGSTVTATNSTSNLDRMNNNPDWESALSEGSSVTRAAGEPPPSSPVYLVALVIPVLLIIILLVVIIKRIQRKPESEPKPVDVQDVDYVNAGVTDDPGDYIALEEQSKNTPAPKYQDLTEKEAPTQVSGYERTILETADAAPKVMPRQGLKRQTDYQYEDVNLGETDARKLPSVPQPDLQSEDDTEYEVPEMFEAYSGVHINTLGASKPITPRPMKITEYKTLMGRERSKVINEIAQQYMALQTGQQHPWTAAIKLQNKPKNFFKALLPYDHSRVRLDTDGSDVRSDYINASYIKNHQGKVSFIAAQGPREGTKDDFWRMVWKEDVETIVMLVDKDGTEQQSKDAQYWPEVNRNQKYGAITVLLMETTAFRSYILREMNVIKGNERVHTVRQYEIPCWKYGGVPAESADLISVIKQIKNHQKGGKHLLVHCSNGVGATGAFIGLYDLMDVIKTKKEVSVFDVIEGMRKDRVNMVLTKLQYLFIFDALLEAMLSPDSQVSCDQLKKLDLSAMKAKCKKEYQILQETTKHQVDLATLAGNSSENNHKNRFPDLLPVDKFRPVLKSPGNVFCSNDYINATFAKDISQRGFIMTQTPLSSTIEDIWRLVFDYNCTSIVMLNTIDDSDESVTVYWPIGHNAASSHGLMTVICKKIDESDVFTRRQFEVKHKRSQKSLLVDHFSFHGWSGNKPDVHKLREFIKYTRTKGTGPALVHCINGVGLSAVYVTVISELERIDKEGAVDVFRTLHRLRKQSPYAVQTQDEYLLCYELLRDHLNNPEEYAVVF